jgi:hypothetical protein
MSGAPIVPATEASMSALSLARHKAAEVVRHLDAFAEECERQECGGAGEFGKMIRASVFDSLAQIDRLYALAQAGITERRKEPRNGDTVRLHP